MGRSLPKLTWDFSEMIEVKYRPMGKMMLAPREGIQRHSGGGPTGISGAPSFSCGMGLAMGMMEGWREADADSGLVPSSGLPISAAWAVRTCRERERARGISVPDFSFARATKRLKNL